MAQLDCRTRDDRCDPLSRHGFVLCPDLVAIIQGQGLGQLAHGLGQKVSLGVSGHCLFLGGFYRNILLLLVTSGGGDYQSLLLRRLLLLLFRGGCSDYTRNAHLATGRGNHVGMLLALVLEKLGLAGVLFVAVLTGVWDGGHASHGLRVGRVGQAGELDEGSPLTTADREVGPRVVLHDVSLPLRARLVHLDKNGLLFFWLSHRIAQLFQS